MTADDRLRLRRLAGTLLAMLALTGCGRSTDEPSTASSSTTTTTSAAAVTPPPVATRNPTIADYIKANGITETPVHRGDPGAPTVDLPVPQNWADAGDKTPAYALAAMVGTDPAQAANPPAILVLMSKLTGPVDPVKLLRYAGGELSNLPGFQAAGAGPSTLGGFDGYRVSGAYVRDGQARIVAQKTVAIPVADGVYVLQINANGLATQSDSLDTATADLDRDAIVTP